MNPSGRDDGTAEANPACRGGVAAKVLGPLAVALALGIAGAASAAAGVTGVTGPASAGAEPRDAPSVTRMAKAHFRAGAKLYRQARYREAISEFEAAYRLKAHGVIFYNLAQCYERMGDIAAALRAYHEYLRAMPRAEDRATVQAAMRNLEARLAATGMQQLLVYTDPPGAEVQVDGRPRGSTPFVAVLSLGVHGLSLSKPGFATLEREVLLSRDRSVEIDIALQHASPATAAPAPSLGLDLTQAAPGASAASLAAPAPKASPTHRPRIFTWVATGVAAGALAAGIAYGIAARNASNDLRRTEHGSADAQRLADTASRRARTANILYGVAGAAGAAGVTLFFVEGHF